MMTTFAQLPILAAVVVYVVEVSGFTQSWRRLLARWLSTPKHRLTEESLRPLPPFDCGVCATWWACLIWSACKGDLSLLTVAESAGLSLLSIPISQLLVFIREGLARLIDIITPK